MTIKIPIVSIIFCVIASAQKVSFAVEGSKATLIADWVQENKQLEPYENQYNQVLENKQIKSLTLSFAYYQDSKFILKHFFNQKISAQLLFLNLDSCKLTLQDISHIFNSINAQSVRHLHINLNSVVAGEQLGGLLGKQLAKFHLKSLKLGLMMLKIGDKGINDLFMHPLNSQLQELSIDFTANKLGPDAFQNFSNFVSQIQVENLKSVELFVRSNRIQENGTLYIAKGLKSFTQLNIFKLDVYFNNLKRKAVKPINLLVRKMTALRILTLNFDFNYIETQGGQHLGKAIQNLENLQYLEIGVGTKNFGYNGFNHIADGMAKLKRLKSLIFRCGVNRLGAKSVPKLKAVFKSNPNIEYVQLHLIENMMTDEGLQLLSASLQELSNLQTFKLNFGFNEVKGKGVVQLLKTLESKKLKNIWIGLSNNLIQDQTITKILPQIESILSYCVSFELQLLYTKISEPYSRNLKKLFEECQKKKGCNCVLHVNTQEQNERIRNQLQTDRKKNKADNEL